MLFDFLLPHVHFFAFARFGLFGLARPVAVRATLGHTTVKGRGRVVNMPPVALTAHIAAVVGHSLQIKASAQTFGGDGCGNGATVAAVKNAVTRHIRRFLPEAAQASKKTKKAIHEA